MRRILTVALIGGLMLLGVVSSARIADALSFTSGACGGMTEPTCIGLGAQDAGAGGISGDGMDGNKTLIFSFSGSVSAPNTLIGLGTGDTIVPSFEFPPVDPNLYLVKLNVPFSSDLVSFLLNFSPFGELGSQSFAALLVKTGHFGGVGLTSPNQEVPEPTMLALLGVGVAGLGIIARRISRQRSAAQA
jgi:hypothetical protein